MTINGTLLIPVHGNQVKDDQYEYLVTYISQGAKGKSFFTQVFRKKWKA